MNRTLRSIVALSIALAALSLFSGAPTAHAAPYGSATFERGWFFYQEPSRPQQERDSRWAMLQANVGKPAPELQVTEWHGEPATMKGLKGKIVVLDFWATWCGPCIRSIPHNNTIAEKYADKDVRLIAICASRGMEKMESTLKQHPMKYATAKDPQDATGAAYGTQWFPFYVIVDRKGIIRAAGLKPTHLEDAIEALLAEDPTPPTPATATPTLPTIPNPAGSAKPAPDQKTSHAASIPAPWLEGSPQRRAQLAAMTNIAPPALKVENWINSEPIDPASLKGKVVVIDFWATWCGPCRAAVPKLNQLMADYGDAGLVVLGVCNTRGAESMEGFVRQHAVKYPVCADIENTTVMNYKVDGFPDYYVIDRTGNLRGADVANAHIEDVVRMLLAE